MEIKVVFLVNKDKLSECGWNDGNGFSVISKKGEVVLFFSFYINGTNDLFVNYVLCLMFGGMKYIVMKWIYENLFEIGMVKMLICMDEIELCFVWA